MHALCLDFFSIKSNQIKSDNNNGIVWRRFHRAVWISMRKLFVRVSWLDILSAYFRKSVCRTILRFFLILSRCNREFQTLICRTDLCPVIDFRLKVIPSWMKKRSLLCKCYNRISIKTGLRRLYWVVSHIKHQQTRNAAQFWATEVFELSNLSSIFFCNKTGGLAINLYRKLNTYAKDVNFSRICSRLVDGWGDMIPYC